MKAEEYFGKELTKQMIDLLLYAKQSSLEERLNLVKYLNREAKKQKGVVSATLKLLAEMIKKIPYLVHQRSKGTYKIIY